VVQFVRVYTPYTLKVTPLSHHEPRGAPAEAASSSLMVKTLHIVDRAVKRGRKKFGMSDWHPGPLAITRAWPHRRSLTTGALPGRPQAGRLGLRDHPAVLPRARRTQRMRLPARSGRDGAGAPLPLLQPDPPGLQALRTQTVDTYRRPRHRRDSVVGGQERRSRSGTARPARSSS
jgi:hypothetical protein